MRKLLSHADTTTGRLSVITGAILLAWMLQGCSARQNQPGDSYEYESMFGQRGYGEGQFREPVGIVLTDDKLFVTDAGNSRIQVFDIDGRFLKAFGETYFQRPMHPGVVGETLLVPDYLADRIAQISFDGIFISSFGSSGTKGGQFDAPTSATVDKDGRIYVADFYNQRVQILGSSGEYLGQLGLSGLEGYEPGQFTYPTSVAVLKDGLVVVADAYNNRIQAFDKDGDFLWMQPEDVHWPDSLEGRFNVATSVAAGADDRIFVADYYNHRIQIFNADGDFVSSFGSYGRGPGEFDRPIAVAPGVDGSIFVVDFGNDRVQKFRSLK